MNILSIQSHVSYGYVGNKAATFPLQSLGFDVWPIHTVQFSNHTGYGQWQGDIFSAQHIQSLIQGLESLALAKECHAVVSGYIGDKAIGETIVESVQRFKKVNPNLIYLCDPVMGNTGKKNCFVKADIPRFFCEVCLGVADIITPNHFEAEILGGMEISSVKDLQQVSSFFHMQGVSIIVITSLQLKESSDHKDYTAFISIKDGHQWLATVPESKLTYPINGTGDLFSALYLGHFLLTKDPVMALQCAMGTTNQIIETTAKTKQRELKIVGHNYKDLHADRVILTPL